MRHSVLALIILAVVLSVSCIVPGAAVSPSSPVIDFEIINPEDMTGSSKAAPNYGSVTQGERDPYTHYVERTDTLFEVSLQWDKTSNNVLQMIVYPPSGSPIYLKDEDDGSINGRIAARTALPGDAVGATWRVTVEGLQVEGSQPYTLIINST